MYDLGLRPTLVHDAVGCLAGIELYWPEGEVGGVVAVEQPVVVGAGGALGQQEGLAHAAVVVDVGQIELGVVAIDAARGENDPVAVAAPVVIGVGVGAVDLVEGSRLHCAQIEEPLVGFLVPYGEAAVVAHGEKQKAAVVGRPGMVGALAHPARVEDGIHPALGVARLRIKAHPTDVVLDALIVGWNIPGIS